MNFKIINNKYFWLVIVIALVAIWYIASAPAPSPEIPRTAPLAREEATPPTPIQQPKAPTKGLPVPPTPLKTLTLISPVASEQWAIGQMHTIKWAPEIGYAAKPGTIFLLDANTKKPVGWIAQNITAKQTAQSWDTRNIFVDQTGSVKKDILPGNYIVVVAYDNSKGQSAAFSIVYPEQLKVPSYNLEIKNFAFSPNTLTVKRGDKIVFTNKDNIGHNLSLLGQSIKNLAPGEVYEMSTQIFAPGQYEIYSANYTATKVTLVIQ